MRRLLLLCVLLPQLAFGFPVNGVLDNFNRANQSPIAGNWTNDVYGVAKGVKLESNMITTITGQAGDAGAWWNAGTFGAQQEVYTELSNYAAWPHNVVGSILMCIQSPGGAGLDAYGIRFQRRDALTDHLEIIRIDNSVTTQFGADHAIELEANAQFGIETTATAGLLQVWAKLPAGAWTMATDRTDSGTLLNCEGTYLGVLPRGSASWFDNFGGGSTVAPATATNPFIRLLLR